ncbi:MAG: glycoside hydrolase family 5 protein [Treponema sp.]|nr:glycoside hydrolase family 5 protein [Treponema sp.]
MNLKRTIFSLIVSLGICAAAFCDTSVYRGKSELNWSQNITVSAARFDSVTQGTTLSFNVTKTKSEYQNIKIYAPTQNGWKELNAGTLSNASYTGAIVPRFSSQTVTVTYTLTKDDAENLKQFGLVVHGYGAQLNTITLSTSQAAAALSEELLFSGSKDFTSWSQNIIVPSSKLSGAQNGSKISVTMKKSASANKYQNLKLYAAKNSGWQELTGGSLENAIYANVIVPSFATSEITMTYALTSSNAEAIRANDLVLQGYGIVITGVSLLGGSSQPVAAATQPQAPNTSTGGVQTTEQAKTGTKSTPTVAQGTPFQRHGKLHVTGAYLMDSHNEKVQLYGLSTHGINFGNDFSRYVDEQAFRTVRDDWNTNCIRLVLYPGDYNGYSNGGNKAQLKKIIENGIEYATNLGMYVIVDWHVHNFNPNNQWKSDAKTFLSEISKKYAKYDNVLYEICNEPTGSSWASSLKPYAQEIIPAIRANAPDSVIIVGTNTWSQDIEEPLANPLSFKNVMYTFHFYANTHTDSYRNRVQNCIERGLPVFVTEFGTCDASGNGGFNPSESRKWFDLCKKYNISHMNWSLSSKAETASVIQPWCQKTSDWSESDLSESGRLVREHFRTLSQ